MKSYTMLLPAAIVTVAAMLIMPGFATDYTGTTESASNEYEVLYITLALGQGQYVDVNTNDVEYHTVTEITKEGRTTSYVIHPNTDPITVSGNSVAVRLIVAYDLALTAPGDLPEYTLNVKCTDGSVSSDFTYYMVWEENAQGGDSGVVAFSDSDLTSTGISVEEMDYSSLRVYIYVAANTITTEPEGKVFNDATLMFSAQAEEPQ